MQTHTLGYPRMGVNRELKKKLESFFKGQSFEDELVSIGRKLTEVNWEIQSAAGIDVLPVGDFSFYDHMLDNCMRFGVIPKRFKETTLKNFDLYFGMACGIDGVPAMEMTKWFDTNYHYIVPEFEKEQEFELDIETLLESVDRCNQLGYAPKVVLPGPFTFLLLGKTVEDFDRFTLLDSLVEKYCLAVKKISEHCDWIQLDEPVLVTDLDDKVLSLFKPAYDKIKANCENSKLMVATYFGPLTSSLDTVLDLDIDAIHVDFVEDREWLESFISKIGDKKIVSAGVVSGRNIWKSDFDNCLSTLEILADKVGEDRLIVSASCSLLHVPYDLDCERELDGEIKSWLSFAKQKCHEINTLRNGVSGVDIQSELFANQRAIESRRISARVNNSDLIDKLSILKNDDFRRNSDYASRAKIQSKALKLPLLATTTIGSFPQTKDVRRTRLKYKKGEISRTQYDKFIKSYIKDCIKKQNDIGLDVLVHGEPERNDMVEYFGERLDGFCFTENGWVQSYGSRCVKPPIIYGDVSRKSAMTVDWIKYASSLTDKYVKGMLTGPVTILSWSFVRDDQPLSTTCLQIAFAVRDEVKDLEDSGIKIIQIDEPALREALPLKKSDQKYYLKWAVDCFRLATSCVRDETQIHTHMCYCEFDDILISIAELDADVISIEGTRSKMELLRNFEKYYYPNEVGPGVYDIHSPAIPKADEMAELLRKGLKVIPKQRLWVNPDCGLKTRSWDEALPSLVNMVEAAKIVRSELAV